MINSSNNVRRMTSLPAIPMTSLSNMGNGPLPMTSRSARSGKLRPRPRRVAPLRTPPRAGMSSPAGSPPGAPARTAPRASRAKALKQRRASIPVMRRSVTHPITDLTRDESTPLWEEEASTATHDMEEEQLACAPRKSEPTRSRVEMIKREAAEFGATRNLDAAFATAAMPSTPPRRTRVQRECPGAPKKA